MVTLHWPENISKYPGRSVWPKGPWVWAQWAWAAFLLPESCLWTNPVSSSNSCLIETAHRQEQRNLQELTEVSKRPSQMVSSCPVDVQVIRAATDLYYEGKKCVPGKMLGKISIKFRSHLFNFLENAWIHSPALTFLLRLFLFLNRSAVFFLFLRLQLFRYSSLAKITISRLSLNWIVLNVVLKVCLSKPEQNIQKTRSIWILLNIFQLLLNLVL